MNLKNMLNETEVEMMRSYIATYAGEDGNELGYNHQNIDMDHILRFWDEAKQSLFRMFGNKFIVTSPISYKEPRVELEIKLENLIYNYDCPGRVFYKAYCDFIDSYWESDRDLYHQLHELMNVDTLLANTYMGASFEFPVAADKKIVVNHGCKASKMLGKIAKALNLPGFEEFRIAHSMCLNQKEVEGTICLSIHPLDYMTMSDNNCDWSSCMSWAECGDYRQGTVEMMNSPYVVVAYLKSKDDLVIGPGVWNSKKWRELFIVSKDIIMGIKQYPYDNDSLSVWCLNKLRELAMDSGALGNYAPQMYKVRNGCHTAINHLGKSIIFHFETNFMYNDVYSEHDAYVGNITANTVNINYSGEAECMYCGEAIHEYPDDLPTNSLLCANHGYFMRCEECGRTIREHDEYYWVDDVRLCEHCYENNTINCYYCEETHFGSNMTKVYLKAPDGTFLSWYHIYVCDNCKDSGAFKKEIGEVLWDDNAFRYYINTNDLKEEGWDLFEVDEVDREIYKNICSE